MKNALSVMAWFLLLIAAPTAIVLFIQNRDLSKRLDEQVLETEAARIRNLSWFKELANAPRVPSESVLRGVSRVAVKVTVPKEEGVPIESADIQKKLELALRRNRIPLADGEAQAVLSLAVTTTPDERGVVFYRVSCQLFTNTLQYQDGKPVSLVSGIWEDGRTGLAGKRVVLGEVHKCVETLADSFSNEYLKYNPK